VLSTIVSGETIEAGSRATVVCAVGFLCAGIYELTNRNTPLTRPDAAGHPLPTVEGYDFLGAGMRHG
jgi:hypothetical protein